MPFIAPVGHHPRGSATRNVPCVVALPRICLRTCTLEDVARYISALSKQLWPVFLTALVLLQILVGSRLIGTAIKPTEEGNKRLILGMSLFLNGGGRLPGGG